ncbi:peptide chain release factor N(5)-glutamine methyltransferase [Psychrosphaera sp. 1_MG-2023]|uniref:peptide chain release factor N(5)-glutamine methyltransferase n=1 Tax=Psychrosphaera sp. 1_MG-2023 TaxID=3062643 RepID=UPI0026E399A2|nr:peptide chain release factor N(5)-glutamine methyltransferase [Psychrosphaera sp. 1_MG-2023]MDO6721077.1 peptide chain release factor N(5)-glutamine methyltransferase [Psychrosphaera sp. 1_MG-2023]
MNNSYLPNSIKQLLDNAANEFSALSDSAKLDAELLMCHVLDCQRIYLFTWPEKLLETPQCDQFFSLVEERKTGRPIAHIVGKRAFWDLELAVNDSTLIPRPDTEILVEKVLEIIESKGPEQGEGLDLGTGTGAIALSLASSLPKWQWTGVDIIPEAVLLARHNTKLNQIPNCQFVESSWFTALADQKFDFIVSNPPYIDENDPHLNLGDVRFEPKTALVAKGHGLADIRYIVENARRHLKRNGKLILEHGFEQGVEVRHILRDFNFQYVDTFKDLSGNDRVSIGYF